MLKLGVPHDALMTEMEALRLFDGSGAVKLLEADVALGAIVLERLKPGAFLSDLADDVQATSIAAQVIRRLWRPAPSEHPFPMVAKWAAGLKRCGTTSMAELAPYQLPWSKRLKYCSRSLSIR